jgi:hypothetical protein
MYISKYTKKLFKLLTADPYQKDDHTRTYTIEIHTVNVPLCQVYLSLYRLDNYATSTLEITKTVDFFDQRLFPNRHCNDRWWDSLGVAVVYKTRAMSE